MEASEISKSYDLMSRSLSEVLTEVQKDFRQFDVRVRQHFGLIDSYLELLKTGAKKTTIRFKLGAVDCPSSKNMDLFENHPSRTDEKRFVGKVIITRMIIKAFGCLDEQDAWNDGFESRIALNKGLYEIYGAIAPSAPVTIYWIHLHSNERTETT